MATRFYLLTNHGSQVQPAIVTWDDATALPAAGAIFNRADHCTVKRPRNGSAVRTISVSAAAGKNVLMGQYVSEPIDAITISGTLKGQVAAFEASASANARTQIRVQVISGDGLTIRGTLYALDNAALSNELTVTTMTNRRVPVGYTGSGPAMTSVDALRGDRILIEIGLRMTPPDGTAYSMSMQLGAPTTSDLPEDETTADTAPVFNPWIEISDTLVFIAAGMGDSDVIPDTIQGDIVDRNILTAVVDVPGTQPSGEGVLVTGDQFLYQQRMYDTVVGWVYYVTAIPTQTPASGDTQPNHTNSLQGGSHQLVGKRKV